MGADGLFSKVILMKDWHTIWLAFAIYALVIAVAFSFKHKHNPIDVENVSH
jgi:NHS family xanthosine MFS transporter